MSARFRQVGWICSGLLASAIGVVGLTGDAIGESGLVQAVNGLPQMPWADASANLTIEELLNLEFGLAMLKTDGSGVNPWSVPSFAASTNPESALVVLQLAWKDESLESLELRRVIRERSNSSVNLFTSMSLYPSVKKRWKMTNPISNLVLRHVRYADPSETLAVTVDGETRFEPKEIAEAEKMVLARGGYWGR